MRKEYILDLITKVVRDKPTAEMVVEVLQAEGLLVLGYGSSEIDNVVQKFVDTLGTTKTTKYDRFAASRLVKKYGEQAICGIIDLYGKSATEKFAPRVNNLTELEAKMPSILLFLRNVKGTEELDV